MSEKNYTTTLKEQCQNVPPVEIEVNILSEGGQIWIQPKGYGEKCTIDGKGYPVGIEIWQGKLRLIIFDDIKTEEPQVIDLERAKESRRYEYCKAAEYLAEHGRKSFTGPNIGGIWNGSCLTASIMSHEQDDKAAYEYLLNFAERHLSILTESQKLLWQETKDNASALLKSTESCDAANKKPM